MDMYCWSLQNCKTFYEYTNTLIREIDTVRLSFCIIFGATGRSSTFLLRRRENDHFIRKTGQKPIHRFVKDIPRTPRPVYEENWQKPNNPTPHTGHETMHQTSRWHLSPSKKGRHSKQGISGAAAPTSTPVSRPRTLAERQNTPNTTHRPRGRAPLEPMTLQPKQEGMTLKTREIRIRRSDVHTGPKTAQPSGRRCNCQAKQTQLCLAEYQISKASPPKRRRRWCRRCPLRQ
jgi:hypothetical protein